MIRFVLPKSGLVKLSIYNIRGQKIETLIHDRMQAGEHKFWWTANGLASGTYFIRLNFGDFTKTQKVVLQK